MGPWAITFGLVSAAAFAVAALFSTRGNAVISGFLFIIWAVTNVWDFPTGSDAQLYLDSSLGLLCCLLCLAVMRVERTAFWPFLILVTIATWLVVTTAYAGDGRKCGPWVKVAYQFASNVLYGLAVLIGAGPGAKRGSVAFFHSLPGRPRRRPRKVLGQGWGREAPDSIFRQRRETR